MKVIQCDVETTFNLISGLWQEHYDEVPLHDGALKFDLDHDLYRGLEAAGFLLNLILIEEIDGQETAIGYMIGIAAPLPHHKGQLELRTDSFYVAKEFRKSGGFFMLLDAFKKAADEARIKIVQVVCNENFKGADDIMRSQGYVNNETAYILSN